MSEDDGHQLLAKTTITIEVEVDPQYEGSADCLDHGPVVDGTGLEEVWCTCGEAFGSNQAAYEHIMRGRR